MATMAAFESLTGNSHVQTPSIKRVVGFQDGTLPATRT